MINILLLIQIIIGVLLIITILLQKNTTDGLFHANNMFSTESANDFLVKTTTILTVLFLVNAVILANLSIKQHKTINLKPESIQNSTLQILK